MEDIRIPIVTKCGHCPFCIRNIEEDFSGLLASIVYKCKITAQTIFTPDSIDINCPLPKYNNE